MCPKELPEGARRKLKYVDQVARLMDSRYRIPGTSIRFGVDPIMSLIPGFGDAGTYLVSLILIFTMLKYGASGRLAARMTVNATLDMFIGAIPVMGTIFDVFYKANNRNVRLLKEHYEEGKHTGSATPVIITALVVLLLLFAGMVFLLYLFLAWVFSFFA